MKSWLMNIAVVSILSSIADMILPTSHISRYAKLCVSLLLTGVIISPILTYNNVDFVIKLPEYDDYSVEEQTSLVDKEFSTRFTNAVITETGFDNISISARLSYNSIINVCIYGALEHQKDEINNILTTTYKIPMEIITYEPA